MRTVNRSRASLLAFVSVFALLIIAAPTRAEPGGNGGSVGKLKCSIVPPASINKNSPADFNATASGGKPPYTYQWTATSATPANNADITNPNFTTTFDDTGNQTVTLLVSDTRNNNPKTCDGSLLVDVGPPLGVPTARGDTYGLPTGGTLNVPATRVSGVLYNDFDIDDVTAEPIGNEGLTAMLDSGPGHATSFELHPDGSFDYVHDGSQGDNDNDGFSYHVEDEDGNTSEVAQVNIHIESDQTDFKIMMNYELGMHCTGFEFSYCCVLPPYNSILAQVVKPQGGALLSNASYPRLLEGDPNNGLDFLGRETVLRDYQEDGTFNKYVLEYYHDAQPRREGQGKPQVPGAVPAGYEGHESTLISAVEGNSLLYHNTPYDSAALNDDGSLKMGTYNGLNNVVLGNNSFTDATDNFANGVWNHLYITADLEGHQIGSCAPLPADLSTRTRCESDGDCGVGEHCDFSVEKDKIRLGVAGMVEYPDDTGAALHPMGPTGNGVFDNLLTFSGNNGTVVYTQMKVLENLPVMLTAPRIWEALGLPLTPFEDTIGFFAEPGSVDEDSLRPYVAMKARLMHADCDEASGTCTKGDAVMGSNGQPVIGFGTAPIDIPNCERCHSAPAYDEEGNPNMNSPAWVRRQDGPRPFYGPAGESLDAMVEMEANYWKMIYPSLTTGSDWYARLKGAAISIVAMHDFDIGTSFSANYPVSDGDNPLGLPPEMAALSQNTRLGHESVICQKCHADNVIAVVKSAGIGSYVVPPITEAIHSAHRSESEGGPIAFSDSYGRSGSCQGCHPAHRSDGVMDSYPITLGGNNFNANTDNRLNQGGCFVARDVHSNPLKDVDGAETPSHLNAVGDWLAQNVFHNQADLLSDEDTRGIWCTNCHTQLGQEMWRAEDCHDLINGDCEVDVRGLGSLNAIAAAIGSSPEEVESWLDPKSSGTPDGTDHTHRIWDASVADANVATIEVDPDSGPVVSVDADGNISVNILSFCTTQDCVDRINGVLPGTSKADQSTWRYPANPFTDTDNIGVAVPFSAATDGRDHWLSPGEPHCADCHAAPYVEPSGNFTAFPPFNYPAKASLMRYSRGHQDISCQGCHESIHGLYPVTPAIDTTTYAQAAALNHDGSHGPLKCGACHQVDGDGIPQWVTPFGEMAGLLGDFDAAVGWAHTYTEWDDVRNSTCLNCHADESDHIDAGELQYVQHADIGRTSRAMMDKAETAELGHVLGATAGAERDQLCTTCHNGGTENRLGLVACNGEWREHLAQGRVSEAVWEDVSLDETGTLCGW